MSHAVPPGPPVASEGAGPRRLLVLALCLAAAPFLLAYIVTQGRHLWDEWSVLQAERYTVRKSAVIGYTGISPRVSLAAKPAAWIHDEGDSTLIWGGWRDKTGHRWFRVGLGDVHPALMSDPIGSDVIRAIDRPVVERGGGVCWERIPEGAIVLGQRLGGVETAYPLDVLNKVLVVNDTIGDSPYLVAINPFTLPEERVGVYETVVDGRRLTMGLTGYIYDGRPLLYDRGTESFWVGRSGAMRAIAGPHKGRVLRRLARPAAVAWGLWRSKYPDSRLVVGADRSHPSPGSEPPADPPGGPSRAPRVLP